MKKSEAEKKICPVNVSDGVTHTCCTDKCMGWVETVHGRPFKDAQHIKGEGGDYKYIEPEQYIEAEGRCGMVVR